MLLPKPLEAMRLFAGAVAGRIALARVRARALGEDLLAEGGAVALVMVEGGDIGERPIQDKSAGSVRAESVARQFLLDVGDVLETDWHLPRWEVEELMRQSRLEVQAWSRGAGLSQMPGGWQPATDEEHRAVAMGFAWSQGVPALAWVRDLSLEPQPAVVSALKLAVRMAGLTRGGALRGEAPPSGTGKEVLAWVVAGPRGRMIPGQVEGMENRLKELAGRAGAAPGAVKQALTQWPDFRRDVSSALREIRSAVQGPGPKDDESLLGRRDALYVLRGAGIGMTSKSQAYNVAHQLVNAEPWGPQLLGRGREDGPRPVPGEGPAAASGSSRPAAVPALPAVPGPADVPGGDVWVPLRAASYVDFTGSGALGVREPGGRLASRSLSRLVEEVLAAGRVMVEERLGPLRFPVEGELTPAEARRLLRERGAELPEARTFLDSRTRGGDRFDTQGLDAVKVLHQQTAHGTALEVRFVRGDPHFKARMKKVVEALGLVARAGFDMPARLVVWLPKYGRSVEIIDGEPVFEPVTSPADPGDDSPVLHFPGVIYVFPHTAWKGRPSTLFSREFPNDNQRYVGPLVHAIIREVFFNYDSAAALDLSRARLNERSKDFLAEHVSSYAATPVRAVAEIGSAVVFNTQLPPKAFEVYRALGGPPARWLTGDIPLPESLQPYLERPANGATDDAQEVPIARELIRLLREPRTKAGDLRQPTVSSLQALRAESYQLARAQLGHVRWEDMKPRVVPISDAGVQATVMHFPGDESVEERIGDFTRAVRLVAAAGLRPPAEITLILHSDPRPGGNVARAGLGNIDYFPLGETRELKLATPHSISVRISRGDKAGYRTAILVHEIIHLIHDEQAPGMSLELHGPVGYSGAALGHFRGLSVYAATKPVEGIAEVGAALVYELPVSQEVMKAYEAFRGPEPAPGVVQAEVPFGEGDVPLPAGLESVQLFAGQVAGRMALVGARWRAGASSRDGARPVVVTLEGGGNGGLGSDDPEAEGSARAQVVAGLLVDSVRQALKAHWGMSEEHSSQLAGQGLRLDWSSRGDGPSAAPGGWQSADAADHRTVVMWIDGQAAVRVPLDAAEDFVTWVPRELNTLGWSGPVPGRQQLLDRYDAMLKARDPADGRGTKALANAAARKIIEEFTGAPVVLGGGSRGTGEVALPASGDAVAGPSTGVGGADPVGLAWRIGIADNELAALGPHGLEEMVGALRGIAEDHSPVVGDPDSPGRLADIWRLARAGGAFDPRLAPAGGWRAALEVVGRGEAGDADPVPRAAELLGGRLWPWVSGPVARFAGTERAGVVVEVLGLARELGVAVVDPGRLRALEALVLMAAAPGGVPADVVIPGALRVQGLREAVAGLAGEVGGGAGMTWVLKLVQLADRADGVRLSEYSPRRLLALSDLVRLVESVTSRPVALESASGPELARGVPGAGGGGAPAVMPTLEEVLDWLEPSAQLGGVNPLRAEGGEFATNCVLAAIAWDIQLAEEDVVRVRAPGAGLSPESDLAGRQRDVLGLGDEESASWFTVTDLVAVEGVMRAAGPGARGFVLVRGGGGVPSHVFNVVHDPVAGAGFHDAQLGEVLAGERLAGVVRSRELVFIPLTAGIAVPAGAVPAVPDPAGRVGAIGVEIEAGFKLSGARFDAGDLLATSKSRAVTLKSDVWTIDGKWAYVVEVVTVPARVLGREQGRPGKDAVYKEVRDIVRRLGEAGSGKSLMDLLPEGFTFTETGERAIVSVATAKHFFPQYTVDVPLAGLHDIMTVAATDGANQPGIRTSALEFGNRVAGDFAGIGGLSSADGVWQRDALDLLGWDEEVTVLRGYAALVYSQVAARASWIINPAGQAAKTFTPVASRVDLNALRSALPARVRDYLEREADRIRADFAARFPQADNILHRPSDSFTVGDYLDTALLSSPQTIVGQDRGLGMATTSRSLDGNGGQMPLVPLELRGVPSMAGLDAVEELHDMLARAAVQIYAASEQMRGLRPAGDAVAGEDGWQSPGRGTRHAAAYLSGMAARWFAATNGRLMVAVRPSAAADLLRGELAGAHALRRMPEEARVEVIDGSAVPGGGGGSGAAVWSVPWLVLELGEVARELTGEHHVTLRNAAVYLARQVAADRLHVVVEGGGGSGRAGDAGQGRAEAVADHLYELLADELVRLGREGTEVQVEAWSRGRGPSRLPVLPSEMTPEQERTVIWVEGMLADLDLSPSGAAGSDSEDFLDLDSSSAGSDSEDFLDLDSSSAGSDSEDFLDLDSSSAGSDSEDFLDLDSISGAAAGPEWLGGVNPLRAEGGEFATNCVLAAIAWDIQLAEEDVVRVRAPGAGLSPESDLAGRQRDVLGLGDEESASWFTVTDLVAVEGVMRAAGPGARGFVLVRGGGGVPSHVFNVVHDPVAGAGFHDAQLGEVLAGERLAGVVRSRELVFIPLTAGIAVPAGAVPAVPDPAGRVGAIGVEIEAGFKLSGARFDAGDLLATSKSRAVTLKSDVWHNREGEFPIVEVVTAPIGVLGTEGSRPGRDAVFQEVRNIVEQLKMAGTRGRLMDLLPEGFTFTETGERAIVSAPPTLRFDPQYTVGVPLSGLYQLVYEALDAGTKKLHESALEFGDQVAADFAGVSVLGQADDGRRMRSLNLLRADEEVTVLRGYAALVYSQVAARATKVRDQIDRANRANQVNQVNQVNRVNIAKAYTPVASRVDLNTLRSALPTGVQKYLEREAKRIKANFVEKFGGGEGLPTLGSHTFTVQDYLDTALVSSPGTVVGQRRGLGMSTTLPSLDDNGGNLPLVPVELRGEPRMADLGAVKARHDVLAESAARIFAAGERMRELSRESEIATKNAVGQLPSGGGLRAAAAYLSGEAARWAVATRGNLVVQVRPSAEAWAGREEEVARSLHGEIETARLGRGMPRVARVRVDGRPAQPGDARQGVVMQSRPWLSLEFDEGDHAVTREHQVTLGNLAFYLARQAAARQAAAGQAAAGQAAAGRLPLVVIEGGGTGFKLTGDAERSGLRRAEAVRDALAPFVNKEFAVLNVEMYPWARTLSRGNGPSRLPVLPVVPSEITPEQKRMVIVWIEGMLGDFYFDPGALPPRPPGSASRPIGRVGIPAGAGAGGQGSAVQGRPLPALPLPNFGAQPNSVQPEAGRGRRNGSLTRRVPRNRDWQASAQPGIVETAGVIQNGVSVANTIIVGSEEFTVDMREFADAIATVTNVQTAVALGFTEVLVQFSQMEGYWQSPSGETFSAVAGTLGNAIKQMLAVLEAIVEKMKATYQVYQQMEQTNTANLKH